MSYSIRIDDELKEKAFPIIEKYGLTPPQAIKLFLKQIAETYSLPLSFNYHANEPNEETRRAMLAADEEWEIGKAKVYNTPQEMYEDLKRELA
ncbi:MAG: type II toxin-antitoxin system RelB/DinJ family antitoxin [Neisseriaceae bacterium]|nr:type II toxin-antitoxin system RelB/DinJ family antitoxin [Neisseriaceae bacterium]MBP5789882.1 type II toxin-antitoxin system RelB/DinJ family antitoxin [Neisseriaceae bacterium]